MNSELSHAILIGAVYIALLGGGEAFYRLQSSRRSTNVRPETMRKVIHSFAGLMAIAFPFLLASHWTLLVLVTVFVTLLIAGQRFNFTKAINATKRDSIGDILFPICVYILFYLSFHDGGLALLPVYTASILILSISDSAAALVGTRWGRHRYPMGGQYKSWEGSLAFAISAFVIIVITLSPSQIWLRAVLAGGVIVVILTLLEAVSLRGTDNITVPIAAFVLVSVAAGLRSFNSIAVFALMVIALGAFASSRVGVPRTIRVVEELPASENASNI